jgi:hypothetical protein
MTTIYFLQTGDMMREDLIIHITISVFVWDIGRISD